MEKRKLHFSVSQKSLRCSLLLAGVWAMLFLWASASLAVKTLPTVPAFEGANYEVLDPEAIPKYVQPLVIPPVMPPGAQDSLADYDIAMRQFNQQILPGGIWNTINGRTDPYPATKVWSYGKAEDVYKLSYTAPMPLSSPKATTFNYPALTVEATQNQLTRVRWINQLFDPKTGNYLPHLLPVDRTLHWANPEQLVCKDGSGAHTDCRPAASNGNFLLNPYKGPVPIVTHVHGARVNPESDGYPEAWWLPAAGNIPAGYATQGSLFDQWDRSNTVQGSAVFGYYNHQRAGTIWYHDHGLGITRLNVYAGPAGFWLIRGSSPSEPDLDPGFVLPGPAPVLGEDPNFDAAVRAKIREIPIAIQGRTFTPKGELFFPDKRAYFETLNHKHKVQLLDIPFFPEDAGSTSGSPSPSDVAPIWNPEFFGNTMVVNGTTWPVLRVAQFPYRLRLLNGTNARTIMLKMVNVNYLNALKRDFNRDGSIDSVPGRPVLPFYQIGSDGGLLPAVETLGQLVMMPAERDDVIVDFTGIPDGTEIYVINEGPDEPFGGGTPPFGEAQANPFTTGQVMKFVVDSSLNNAAGSTDGTASDPTTLTFASRDILTPLPTPRQVSLNEEESIKVCVQVLDDGSVQEIPSVPPAASNSEADIEAFLDACDAADGVSMPFGPTAAKVGTVAASAGPGYSGVPLNWTDMTGASTMVKVFTNASGNPVYALVTEMPDLNSTETWEIFNFTADAHPIHLHLVQFQVVDRQNLTTDSDGVATQPAYLVGGSILPEPGESGWKDTVRAYPGQVTRIKARFDVAGLYVWHCHIIDHEDNEMMRPYAVIPDLNGDGCVDTDDYDLVLGSSYDLDGDGFPGTADDEDRLEMFYTNPGGAACVP